MAALSDMLTYLRKRAGISQQELAAKLGMTRSAIGMYETGKREPDLETLEIFADFYNVDMNTLTGQKSFHSLDSSPALTAKDERDIEKQLNAVLEELESGQSDLAFSGEPLDDVTRELLVRSLRNSMEIGKTLAKQKYTPKKYRKD